MGMKKVIIIVSVITMILSFLPAPAIADNDDSAYLLGGIAGGLLLGQIIENNRPRYYGYPVYDGPVYSAPPRYRGPVYVDPAYETVYEKRCYTRWVKRWSEYRQAWIRKKKTICEWYRAN